MTLPCIHSGEDGGNCGCNIYRELRAGDQITIRTYEDHRPITVDVPYRPWTPLSPGATQCLALRLTGVTHGLAIRCRNSASYDPGLCGLHNAKVRDGHLLHALDPA